MDTQYIVNSLKSTSYKFTKAQQLRDRIKQLPEDSRERLLDELKIALKRPEHSDIHQAMHEMLSGLGS